jgi:hypothetical protein
LGKKKAKKIIIGCKIRKRLGWFILFAYSGRVVGMDVEALKDEKELVSARIDEIEVLLISARGGNKVARLVAELDELEAKKEVLKQQIASVPVKPSVIAASPPTTVRPVQPTAAAPAAIVEPATKNAPKKKKGKKQIGGAVVGDAGDLQALENEVAELERVAEQKEEEEQKARFAMANFRLELSSREASVWEREQRLLKASVEQEPLVKHAVRLQRIFRRREEKKIRGDAKLKGIVKQYLKSSEAKQGREKVRNVFGLLFFFFEIVDLVERIDDFLCDARILCSWSYCCA